MVPKSDFQLTYIPVDCVSNIITFQMLVKPGYKPMQSQMSSKEIAHAKTERSKHVWFEVFDKTPPVPLPDKAMSRKQCI